MSSDSKTRERGEKTLIDSAFLAAVSAEMAAKNIREQDKSEAGTQAADSAETAAKNIKNYLRTHRGAPGPFDMLLYE